MRRWTHLTALIGATALAACGGQVVVQAMSERDGQEEPIPEMPVEALPYDRDQVFDSLAAAYSEPEPVPSDSLEQLIALFAELQTQHAEAQDRWGTIRDSLQQINEQLEGMNPASPQYRILFADFNALDGQVGAAERAMDQAFTELNDVRATYNEQVTDFRTRYDLWAEEAFESYNDVIMAKLDELGRDEVSDTTDANGVVYLNLPTGQWWIHARHDLATEELYWNLPVEIGGDPAQLLLNRANAEVRRKY